MCIRDSFEVVRIAVRNAKRHANEDIPSYLLTSDPELAIRTCLLYTSDAADERSSVDLGGRRIIKKKNNQTHRQEHKYD